MTRSYLPPTSTMLAYQIENAWRGDFTDAGRAHKDEGADVRHALCEMVERASCSLLVPDQTGARHG